MAELKARGLGAAALSYDSPAILADFTRRRGIQFPLLSDAGSKTIRAFGLLNTTLTPTDTNYGIPFPGTFIVDVNGVVRERYFENAFQERRTVASMLRLDRPGAAATQSTTDHLRVVSYASDETVAPGTVFSLQADITPGDGIHVYAPGRHSYRVVSIEIDPVPLLKTTRATVYPPSEIYHFVPLNERVAVYQKPFRLAREVVFDASAAAQETLRGTSEATIIGRLDYQACSDTFCFAPVSVPLSWTVKIRTLDRERVQP